MQSTDPPIERREIDGDAELLRTVVESLAPWLLRGGETGSVGHWSEREWRVAAWVGYWQSVTPWLLQRAAEQGIEPDPEVRPRLERADRLMRARTERILAEAAEALTALATEDIPVIPLKGVVISPRFLADPASRPMRDIDLLVAPSDFDRTGSVLQTRGYRLLQATASSSTWALGDLLPETWSPDHLRPIDLHTSAERDIAHLGLDIDRLLWSRSSLGDLLGAPALVPQGPALLIHTAAHASRNLLMGNASLSHLRDLDAIGGTLGEKGWDEVLRDADPVVRRHVFPAIALLERSAPGTVPATVLDAFERSAGRRMRSWFERSGIGKESRRNHTVRSATPDAARAMVLLAKGPREHLRLAFPPREHVFGPDRTWADTPAWPFLYLWRRGRSAASLAAAGIGKRR